ncbi:hypothetical protein PC9H_006142 [Pleurotus ostreatus]|uniref:Uncharacterized protein n=1 Tax=Pleurotus ostreatus TaxID=5322 RepID=A0A8H6ZW50_PLEOS|nr:uncharacterized protein PC9H_006142 [Pleurotus ostreatus]KAF7430435.1 hypothetical protein PC9H_006142 [Pleurotus ostreatus]
MKALYYHGLDQVFEQPREFEVTDVPIPEISDDQVLIKVSLCGMLSLRTGTQRSLNADEHQVLAVLICTCELIPGHEVVGVIEKVGRSVTEFSPGDRCVADNSITCEHCFYCRRGNPLLCENFASRGVTMAGGFAEYVAFEAKKVYKIHNLTDEEATLVEPAACAIHGMDRLNAAVGIDALIVGAGPTGLILAQLLKLNGAAKVVIAANKGIKTQVAKDLDAGDVYIELDRDNPGPQWRQLKDDNPYGFDVVIEATGSAGVANEAINYVRRGGTLMIYGVYSNDALVHWSPAQIFSNEIRIVGSFAQVLCFPRAVAYLDSGKINVKGMVTDVFRLEDYDKVLEKMKDKSAVKIAVRPT